MQAMTSLFFNLDDKQRLRYRLAQTTVNRVTTDGAEGATCYANTKEKGGVNQSTSYRKRSIL